MSLRRASLIAIALSLPAATWAQDSYQGVERIVAVGDVHGDLGQFTTILRQAGVIDGKNRWIGGATHLVQTGDVLDRGAESRKVMELLMALAPEAEKAGGKVHALIGNHEAMNILGDLRYVSAGEYQAFATAGSAALRERVYRALADSARRDDPDYRTQWEADHPLGWVEHRLAFEGNGRYASWIRQHDAVLKIDQYLFVHGGIGPAIVELSLSEINARVRRALEPGAQPAEVAIAEDSTGPLWYRGLALGDEATLSGHVDQVLAHFGVAHVVIGHSVTPGAILPRFGGKVVMIDVGLSAAYGGPPACLIVERGKPYALHRGQKLELPIGGDPFEYLGRAAALDPPGTRLRKYLEQYQTTPP